MNQPTEDASNCPSFEDALKQLEAIVHDLEEGQVGLGEALSRYEEGVRLLRQCYKLLENAERKIEALCEVDAAGNAKTVKFDDQATLSCEEKPASGAGRRPQAVIPRRPPTPSPQSGMDEADRLF
jgi:exodeoxyribonuclease VII small subunit